MLIGGFVSAAGGIDQAIVRANEREFEVAMFFIGSPHSWRLPKLSPSDAEKVKRTQNDTCVKRTYAHALYLANLATPDQELYEKSVQALTTTMQNGETIGLNGVIFHLGSHKNTTTEQGIDRVVTGMRQVLKDSPGETKLIMENSVQQGDKVGTNLAELGYILKELNDPRVAVCFDTCHGFAMGYDYANTESFQKLINDIEQNIGFDKLTCMHTNDSQGELNSHIDRHTNIGEGHIGLEGFKAILNSPHFNTKDFILEIPGTNDDGPAKKDRDLLLSLVK